MATKTELMDKIRPILAKGKPINDIIFVSQKMGYLDKVLMLQWLRPTRKESSSFFSRKPASEYGWDAEKIYGMVENPVLTGGGDGLEQLVFGCIAALDVYTEDEILTVLDAQKQFCEIEA